MSDEIRKENDPCKEYNLNYHKCKELIKDPCECQEYLDNNTEYDPIMECCCSKYINVVPSKEECEGG